MNYFEAQDKLVELLNKSGFSTPRYGNEFTHIYLDAATIIFVVDPESGHREVVALEVRPAFSLKSSTGISLKSSTYKLTSEGSFQWDKLIRRVEQLNRMLEEKA